MKTHTLFAMALVLSLLVSGCVTREQRISGSPEVFARLSPEQQILVKQGKVGLGFDADAVRLSLGAPDRKWARTDAAGTSEVWSYLTTEPGRGWYTQGMVPFYYPAYPDRREHEYFKVTFGADGKVTAVEEDLPR